MSWNIYYSKIRMIAGWGLILTAGLFLSGCYTRQIDGLQKDLDSFERKLHSAKLKDMKGGGASSQVSNKSLAKIEDRVNRLHLENANLAEELSTLRQSYANLKQDQLNRPSSPAIKGSGDVSRTEIERLRRQVEETKKTANSSSTDVKKLNKTFDKLRNETHSEIQTLIAILQEDLGESDDMFSGPSSAAPSEVLAATHLESPASIYSQEEKADRADPLGGTTYKVKAGDTLSGIAKKHSVTPEELARVNFINNPKNVSLGQLLLIP